MIDSGVIGQEGINKESLKAFAIACFSASLPNKPVGCEEAKDYLKSFAMERAKMAAVNKVKTDGEEMVFASRVVDYLVSRKYFTDFSSELKKHPKVLAAKVLSELEGEGILEFSKNKKRVSIK